MLLPGGWFYFRAVFEPAVFAMSLAGDFADAWDDALEDSLLVAFEGALADALSDALADAFTGVEGDATGEAADADAAELRPNFAAATTLVDGALIAINSVATCVGVALATAVFTFEDAAG